jgi:YggT family protein
MPILHTIVLFLGKLAVIFFLLRLLLQLVRADYYNPLSQAIVRFTEPLCGPLRKIFKPTGRLDVASLMATFLVQFLVVTLLLLTAGASLSPSLMLLVLKATPLMLVDELLGLLFICMLIVAISSWIAPGSSHPGLQLLYQIIEPVAQPVRKIIPPMGGLDLSFIFLFLGIYLVQNHLLYPLAVSTLGTPLTRILGIV